MVIQVTYKQICFGLQAKNGRITAAAPVARWTIGKDVGHILKEFTKRQGVKIVLLPQNENEVAVIQSGYYGFIPHE